MEDRMLMCFLQVFFGRSCGPFWRTLRLQMFTVLSSCMNCNALTFSPWEYVCSYDQCICASLGRKGVFWTHILMARTEAFQNDELEVLMRILKESLIADMKNCHVSTDVGEETPGSG